MTDKNTKDRITTAVLAVVTSRMAANTMSFATLADLALNNRERGTEVRKILTGQRRPNSVTLGRLASAVGLTEVQLDDIARSVGAAPDTSGDAAETPLSLHGRKPVDEIPTGQQLDYLTSSATRLREKLSIFEGAVEKPGVGEDVPTKAHLDDTLSQIFGIIEAANELKVDAELAAGHVHVLNGEAEKAVRIIENLADNVISQGGQRFQNWHDLIGEVIEYSKHFYGTELDKIVKILSARVQGIISDEATLSIIKLYLSAIVQKYRFSNEADSEGIRATVLLSQDVLSSENIFRLEDPSLFSDLHLGFASAFAMIGLISDTATDGALLEAKVLSEQAIDSAPSGSDALSRAYSVHAAACNDLAIRSPIVERRRLFASAICSSQKSELLRRASEDKTKLAITLSNRGNFHRDVLLFGASKAQNHMERSRAAYLEALEMRPESQSPARFHITNMELSLLKAMISLPTRDLHVLNELVDGPLLAAASVFRDNGAGEYARKAQLYCSMISEWVVELGGLLRLWQVIAILMLTDMRRRIEQRVHHFSEP